MTDRRLRHLETMESITTAHRTFILHREQSMADTIWYPLFLDGASLRLTIPADTLWNFEIKLVGLTQGAPQRWSYDIRGTVVNDGGTTTLIESVVTTRAESDTAYEAQAVGNDALDCLDIEVRCNGGTSYTVHWVAVVDVAQVTFPA